QHTRPGMGGDAPLATVADEYKTLAVSVGGAGQVGAFHMETGTRIDAPSFDLEGELPTAFARTLSGRDIAFGFADGTLRLGALKVGGAVFNADDAPEGLRSL